VFLLSALPAAFIAKDISLSLKGYLIYLSGAIIFFVTYFLARKDHYRKYVERTLYLIIAYVTLLSFKSLYMYFIQGIFRPTAGLGTPITLSQFLDLTIPLLIALFLCTASSMRKKSLLFVLIGVFSLALIITYTRGAWIGLFVSVVGLMAFLSAYRQMAVGAVLVVILGLSQYSLIVKRLSALTDISYVTNLERLYGWSVIPQIIATHPLGLGFGHFKFVYPAFMLPQAQEKLAHAHQNFLGLATDAGIIAAMAFFLFIGCIFYFVVRYWNLIVCNYHRYLVVGCLFSLFALFLHGFVDYPIRKFNILALFMFEAGLAIGLTEYYLLKLTSADSKVVEKH
jgi:O-antigen ligase